MISILESFIDKPVSLVTSDGRVFVGTLKSFDQSANAVLQDCVERVFRGNAAGVRQVPRGLCLVRGAAATLIGEIDTEIDGQLDYTSICAPPIRPIGGVQVAPGPVSQK